MRRVLLGILATLELGGGARRDPAERPRVEGAGRGAEDRATAGVETTTSDPGRSSPSSTRSQLIPDLEGALVPGYDFIDNDLESQDVDSHGTRVASVIAARGNNGVGMAGHCWKCRIMPVRISENGTTTPAGIATGSCTPSITARRSSTSASRIETTTRARRTRSGTPPSVVPSSSRRRETRATTSRSIQPRTRACSRSARRTWRTRSTLVEPRALGAVDRTWVPHGRRSLVPARHALRHVLHAERGRWRARTPLVTQSEPQPRAGAVGRARDRPADPGIAAEIDPAAAFRRLGRRSRTPPAAPPNPTPRPAPGQRFTRQTIFETGTFKRGFRSTFRVGRGRFELQLLTPLASACSLSSARRASSPSQRPPSRI